MKNKNLIKILLIAVAVVAAGAIYTVISSSGSRAEESVVYDLSGYEEADEPAAGEEETVLETAGQDEPGEPLICVHVCGQVVAPGVYYLPQGSRIHQAIELAGGFTAEADQSVVNMASLAVDGMQVYIPDKEEAKHEGMLHDFSQPESESDGLVNINTADAALLMTLPGIGQAKADAIIAYRTDNGTFKAIEDIQNVAGIKDGSYSKLKDLIKV